MTLLSFLPRGRDKAKPIGEIAEQSNRSRRRVERDLETLVLSGIPIVACESGVYVATSPQEARQYASALKGRIGHIADRAAALERWADRQEQPRPTLWDAA
jgi:predicted DNA-binding transcriptional regulator YafY